MKRIFHAAGLFVCQVSLAQNLVPNPGFENTGTFSCGIFGTSDLSASLNNWINPTAATPDAYSTQIASSCYNHIPSSTYTGPIGLKGYQDPRNGNVMAGIYVYTIPSFNQREYITTQLTSPLIVNETYAVSFYANLPNNSEKYINGLGAYLSMGAPSATNDQPLNFTPQVMPGTIVNDTLNWTLITDTIVVSSAFEYLTIGNFADDNNTTTYLNPGGSSGPGNYGAYYFIDDVSVTHLQPKNGMAEEQDPVRDIYTYSIGNGDVFGLHFVSAENITVQLCIYDVTGKTINEFSVEAVRGPNDFSFPAPIPAGIYFLSLYTIQHSSTVKFIQINN